MSVLCINGAHDEAQVSCCLPVVKIRHSHPPSVSDKLWPSKVIKHENPHTTLCTPFFWAFCIVSGMGISCVHGKVYISCCLVAVGMMHSHPLPWSGTPFLVHQIEKDIKVRTLHYSNHAHKTSGFCFLFVNTQNLSIQQDCLFKNLQKQFKPVSYGLFVKTPTKLYVMASLLCNGIRNLLFAYAKCKMRHFCEKETKKPYCYLVQYAPFL